MRIDAVIRKDIYFGLNITMQKFFVLTWEEFKTFKVVIYVPTKFK